MIGLSGFYRLDQFYGQKDFYINADMLKSRHSIAGHVSKNPKLHRGSSKLGRLVQNRHPILGLRCLSLDSIAGCTACLFSQDNDHVETPVDIRWMPISVDCGCSSVMRRFLS